MLNPLTLLTKKGVVAKENISKLNDLRKKHGLPETNWRRKVFLAIDTSGSMNDSNKLNQAKSGARGFVEDALKDENLVGIIAFGGNDPKLICKLTGNSNAVRQAIENLEAGGGTPMAQAIKLAHNRLENSGVIVVITDGAPNSEEEAIKTANNAKRDGIHIITIGTDLANREFLNKISSGPNLASKISISAWGDEIRAASKKLLLLPEN